MATFPFLLFLDLESTLLLGEFRDVCEFPFQKIPLHLKFSPPEKKKKENLKEKKSLCLLKNYCFLCRCFGYFSLKTFSNQKIFTQSIPPLLLFLNFVKEWRYFNRWYLDDFPREVDSSYYLVNCYSEAILFLSLVSVQLCFQRWMPSFSSSCLQNYLFLWWGGSRLFK